MRIRRNSPEPRMEMTPLLDVIFLLLTFFVFAAVLMVRANVLGITLPELSSGEAAREQRTITVAIDAEGRVLLEGETIAADRVVEGVRRLRAERPGAGLLIATDTRGPSGALLEVIDRLSAASITDFALVGRTAPTLDEAPAPERQTDAGGGG